MKSLHFCTRTNLEIINSKEKKVFRTIRTGYVPELYKKDLIMLRDKTKNDKIIGIAQVIDVKVEKFRSIKNLEEFCEEIERYKRNFNDEHYFFIITLYKIPDIQLFPLYGRDYKHMFKKRIDRLAGYPSTIENAISELVGFAIFNKGRIIYKIEKSILVGNGFTCKICLTNIKQDALLIEGIRSSKKEGFSTYIHDSCFQHLVCSSFNKLTNDFLRFDIEFLLELYPKFVINALFRVMGYFIMEDPSFKIITVYSDSEECFCKKEEKIVILFSSKGKFLINRFHRECLTKRVQKQFFKLISHLIKFKHQKLEFRTNELLPEDFI